jgi:acyl carrier protein
VSDLAAELVTLISTDIAAHADQPVEPSTDLLLTGLVDSLGVVRIVHWIEQHHGFQIDAADVTLDNFQTVDAMVRYVEARVAAAA